jgi:hypothetical protein
VSECDDEESSVLSASRNPGLNREIMVMYDPTALVMNWAYHPSNVAMRIRVKRWRSWTLRRVPSPSSQVVRPPVRAERWNVVFLFVPSGTLDADQRGILDRVRALRGKLMVVCAVPGGEPPPDIERHADAIIVKALRGFDFSAYRLALDAIARSSPGATVYVQNDSVLGPFGDVDRLVEEAPWDLTSFMAASAVENHACGFAFVLRDVTPSRVDALTPVLSRKWCCDAFEDVVLLQETQLARVAARSMSVGSWWYLRTRPELQPLAQRLLARLPGRRPGRPNVVGDAMLACPVELLDAGFPFLKRSLFTKFGGLHDRGRLEAALRAHGWHVNPRDKHG